MATGHVTAVEVAVRRALLSDDIDEVRRIAMRLVRLIDCRTAREIHSALGAPGDWGYESQIGVALYALYNSSARVEDPLVWK